MISKIRYFRYFVVLLVVLFLIGSISNADQPKTNRGCKAEMKAAAVRESIFIELESGQIQNLAVNIHHEILDIRNESLRNASYNIPLASKIYYELGPLKNILDKAFVDLIKTNDENLKVSDVLLDFNKSSYMLQYLELSTELLREEQARYQFFLKEMNSCQCPSLESCSSYGDAHEKRLARRLLVRLNEISPKVNLLKSELRLFQERHQSRMKSNAGTPIQAEASLKCDRRYIEAQKNVTDFQEKLPETNEDLCSSIYYDRKNFVETNRFRVEFFNIPVPRCGSPVIDKGLSPPSSAPRSAPPPPKGGDSSGG